MADMVAFQNNVADRLQTVLAFGRDHARGAGSIERSAGKSKRVLDRREDA